MSRDGHGARGTHCAPWHTSRHHHVNVPLHIQPLIGHCLPMGWGALRTNVPTCRCHEGCLQDGCYMQRAGSIGVLDRASTALAHQLPGVAGSASSLAAVLAAAAGQARVGPLSKSTIKRRFYENK